MTDKHISQIERDEHAVIGGRSGKKIHILPQSIYQNASLASGYNYYGFCVPGSNPTQSAFRIMREDIANKTILYAEGSSKYGYAWSSASLASISYY